MSSPTSTIVSEIVRAGAGAGKTTTLVEKVFNVVEEYRRLNQKYPKMVVTTFTKKATQELRERLTVKACEMKDFGMLDYCRSSSQLHMSTIHGVLSLFLRRYGHLMEVDPSFSILSENNASALQRQVLRDCLMTDSNAAELLQTYNIGTLEKLLRTYRDKVSVLTKSQILDSEAMKADLANEAGALATEISNLVMAGKAATNHPKMLSFLSLLQEVGHQFAEPWSHLQFEKVLSLLDELPSKPANTKGEWSAELDTKVGTLRAQLRKWLSRPSSDPAWLDELAKTHSIFGKFAERFNASFRQQKLSSGQLEMSDLENLTIDLIRKHPVIAAHFSADWDFWMIDEFQDTSPLQIELLKMLRGDRPRFLVGDPQQSIYLFRGARVEVFHEEQESFEKEGLTTVYKMKNYRSEPSLLLFLNDFFMNLGPQFSSMLPRNQDLKPLQTVAYFQGAKTEENDDSEIVEYENIRKHILFLMKERSASASDICILSRTNKVLMNIAKYLKSHGIPTHVHSSSGFFSRREIVDAMAILKFLVNPHDNLNLMILLRSPWCRVEDSVIIRTISREGGSHWRQLSEQLVDSEPVISRLKEWLTSRSELPLSQIWERALTELGFFDHCQLHDKTGRREANLWKLVNDLAVAERKPGFNVLQFMAGTAKSDDEDGFDSDGDAMTAVEPNFVNLMTIHASKGLQRKHIVLPACGQPPRLSRPSGLQVHVPSQTWTISSRIQREDRLETLQSSLAERVANELNARELDEYQRLLYVALTRAEETVYLSWSGEPKEDSWAASWSPRYREPGQHKTENYKFEVLVEPQNVSDVAFDREEVVTARAAWSQSTKSEKQTISVTEIVQRIRPDLIDSQRTEGVRDRVERMVFGNEMHRLFQKMKWRENFNWQNDNPKVLEAMSWALSLETPPLAKLIQNGHPEWGFQVNSNLGRLIGQIDLWCEWNNEIWVIDYKTGHPTGEAKAMDQLDLYAFALRQFGLQAPIRLCAIFPMHKHLAMKAASSDSEIKMRFQIETRAFN